ncbi:MAG: flavin reductase family protein [Crocinitomicaceae bacterium]
MLLNKNDITTLSLARRINLINSVTGIKPGNLIGTVSNFGNQNAAVISSVVHLSSNPALIGFFMRPHKDFRRDTLNNILETGYFSINSIPLELTKNAHYTSAKFDEETSEFEACNLTPEIIDNFVAPFVQESAIKIGMKLTDTVPISASNTTLVIGEIELLNMDETLLSEEYYIHLDKAGCAGIGGLNSYYSLKLEDSYPYVRLHEIPVFKDRNRTT